ncbi:unnamed protein product [Phytophthora fragariaefolia]|uniref:Unnamed protein product n=1 Tax=Phytophthora fragariaefolia TaxID=1490495 RepID=A0A9W6YL92_9STRA|nr:unnamed protein product [Phytophthora fragariaefolia]
MIAVQQSEGHTGILPVYRSWSRRLLDNTDESDAGGVCSLYAGARRVVQVVLGRSGGDCYVPSQSVSHTRDQPRQVAAPSVDGKEAAARQSQGVRLSRIRACAEGEAIQVRLEVSTLPFCRVFGARESVSV